VNGRYHVRPRARYDIAEIAHYIAVDNLEISDRFIDAVYQAFEQLARMPNIGSARRFRRVALRGLRLWRVPHFEKYLIVYQPRQDGMEVVRVLHAARNIERLLGQRGQR
jgi:toxin ParE1/3/4